MPLLNITKRHFGDKEACLNHRSSFLFTFSYLSLQQKHDTILLNPFPEIVKD